MNARLTASVISNTMAGCSILFRRDASHTVTTHASSVPSVRLNVSQLRIATHGNTSATAAPKPSAKAQSGAARTSGAKILRREATCTPLQAFVTLNDPAYVEAAQALARRVVAEGGSTTEDRVRYALRLCLSRPPAVEQVAGLLALYQTERDHYAANPAAAVALATEPLGPLASGSDPAEMAAWTTIANVLLNLDGVLTKG